MTDDTARTGPKDLGLVTRPGRWRDGDGGRAARLGPREVIGRQVARRGRWAGVDPLRTPRLWNRYRWMGLGLWAGLIAGAGWKAWRGLGGPRAAGRALLDD